MKFNLVGPFILNAPFGTEIAFAKGLRRIGHEVIEVDPNLPDGMGSLDRSADATVVFKTCCGNERSLDGLKHPTVVYQPDDTRFPHIQKMIAQMRRWSDLFLSFDDHGAAVAKGMGYRAAETLLLTADDELYCPPPGPVERDIDVSFIGSMGDYGAHASRRRMVEIVREHGEKRGWNMAFGTTQDVPRILDVYRRSKVVLNHATDVGQGFGRGYGIQCRHFEVGMAGSCLLTNSFAGEQSLDVATFSDEQSLLDYLSILVSSMGTRDWVAKRWSDEIRERHLPQHRAAQLVDFIGRNA